MQQGNVKILPLQGYIHKVQSNDKGIVTPVAVSSHTRNITIRVPA